MKLLDALASTNVRAFLVMIRHGEGTSDDDGYRRMFGGKLFDGYADHPRQLQTFPLKKGGTLSSTAAGAYQILSKTWDGLVRQWGFQDFSPHSQDLAAIALILGRKALDDVIAGRFDAAVAKCNKEWASLPGSPYGQPTTTLATAREIYEQAGGCFAEADPPLVQLDQISSYADPDLYITPGAAPTAAPLLSTPTTQEPAMAPFLLAALPALFDAVPKLVKSFTDDGVTVPQRNAQAIQIAVDVAKEALNVQTEQQLAEAVKADPQAAAAVRAAIDASWARITDAGGIPEARKADAEFVAKGEPPWRSPSFLISVGLLPLVYLLVGAVVGLFGQPFSDDVRSAIANGVIGLILGGLTGYYFGQTTTRNRTPQAGGAGN